MGTFRRPPGTIFEVWKNLPEGTLSEIINNGLSIRPSPSDVHQVVLNAINIYIYKLLKKNRLGEIRVAPYDVHFSKQNIFQPDLIFILNENIKWIKARGLFGVPDMVVEVLFPGTAEKDKGEKKTVYEQYGVKELFLVEPETKTVSAFILQDNKFVAGKETTAFFKSQLLKTTIKF